MKKKQKQLVLYYIGVSVVLAGISMVALHIISLCGGLWDLFYGDVSCKDSSSLMHIVALAALILNFYWFCVVIHTQKHLSISKRTLIMCTLFFVFLLVYTLFYSVEIVNVIGFYISVFIFVPLIIPLIAHFLSTKRFRNINRKGSHNPTRRISISILVHSVLSITLTILSVLAAVNDTNGMVLLFFIVFLLPAFIIITIIPLTYIFLQHKKYPNTFSPVKASVICVSISAVGLLIGFMSASIAYSIAPPYTY